MITVSLTVVFTPHIPHLVHTLALMLIKSTHDKNSTGVLGSEILCNPVAMWTM